MDAYDKMAKAKGTFERTAEAIRSSIEEKGGLGVSIEHLAVDVAGDVGGLVGKLTDIFSDEKGSNNEVEYRERVVSYSKEGIEAVKQTTIKFGQELDNIDSNIQREMATEADRTFDIGAQSYVVRADTKTEARTVGAYLQEISKLLPPKKIGRNDILEGISTYGIKNDSSLVRLSSKFTEEGQGAIDYVLEKRD